MGVTKGIASYLSKATGPMRSAVNMVVRRAKITAVDTSSGSVRVSAKVNGYETHDGVELLEPYGFTSAAPLGSKALLLCSGGDGGHPIGLMAGSPSVRLSGLASGEVAIHVGAGPGGGTGARIVLRTDGSIEVGPGPGQTVRVVPNGAVGPLPVARAGDPVAVTSPALLTLKQALEAWAPAAGDGGAALKTVLGTFIALSETAVVQGAGTITGGGTGMVST